MTESNIFKQNYHAELRAAAKAKNTRRMYRSAWENFIIFCNGAEATPLPAEPETIANYLAFLAKGGRSVSTLRVHLCAISEQHRNGNHAPNPVTDNLVRDTFSGIRREYGKPQQGVDALTLAELKKLVDALPIAAAPTEALRLRHLRDRALLLLAFAGAFRRSEIAGLEKSDVSFGDECVRITLRRSKTDKSNAGFVKTIPRLSDRKYCPVANLEYWIKMARIRSGALWRGVDRWGHLSDAPLRDQMVWHIVLRTAKRAGLVEKRLGAHSTRKGFVTAGYRNHVPEAAMQAMTGHTKREMLARYNTGKGAQQVESVRAIFEEDRT